MNNKREEACAERVWQMAGVEEGEEGEKQLRDADGRMEVRSRGGAGRPSATPKGLGDIWDFSVFPFPFFVGPPSNRS